MLLCLLRIVHNVSFFAFINSFIVGSAVELDLYAVDGKIISSVF